MASRAQNKIYKILKQKRKTPTWVAKSQNILSGKSTRQRKKNIRLSDFTIAQRNFELAPVKRWHKLKIERLQKLQNEAFMYS